MENVLRPRWTIETAVRYGNEAHTVALKYQTDLSARLKTDELANFKLQNTELAKRQSGQTENLVNQKTKTKSQDEMVKEIHLDVVSIRNLVRSNKPSEQISIAYGIGEKINSGVTNIIVAANLVINAFTEFSEWSKSEANILDDDINELKEELDELKEAAGIQDASTFYRKYATMDKNVLQRLVEDEVIRLSALGAHVFRKKNPSVAALFENLIPAASKAEETEQAPS